MSFGLGSIKSGPILEYPLIEQNGQRQVRPVYINIRKVKGKRGWLLRRFGYFIAPNPTPEGLGHHAIQVGDYAYELHTDEANQKYLLVQRLTTHQIWLPTIGRSLVGYCDLADDEIAMQAMKVQSWMRGREGGRYHVKRNNCQHFVQELRRRLTTDTAGKDTVTQALQSLDCIALDCCGHIEESKDCGVEFHMHECSSDEKSMSTLCND